MTQVILVIHVLLAISMICVVLLQRSEGGALGIGGGGGFMSGRSTSNLLTRATAVLAGLFMLTSLSLTIMAGNRGDQPSIVDEIQTESTTEAPAEPASPSVPIAE